MVLVGIQMGPNAGLLASVYYFCSMTLQGKVTDSGLMNRSLAHSYSKEERAVLNNLLNFSQLVTKVFMSFLFKWQLVFVCFFFFLLGNKNNPVAQSMVLSRERRVFKLWKEAKGCQRSVVMNEAGLSICSEHVLQDSSTTQVTYKSHNSNPRQTA